MVDDRVTVVVITHNRCQELHRTLTALERLPERPAVIVVDNDSSDDPCEMVRALHPAVLPIPAQTNLGAVGRNLGAKLATTPYIAFCDDDTW